MAANGIHLTNAERAEILDEVDRGTSVAQIADAFGCTRPTIYALIKKYHPTTKLATRLIKSKALLLAERVIKRATVEEAIEVLSRPNIAVLEPAARNDHQAPQILMSITQNSCGGVIEAKPARSAQGTAIIEATGQHAVGDDQGPAEQRSPLAIGGDVARRWRELHLDTGTLAADMPEGVE